MEGPTSHLQTNAFWHVKEHSAQCRNSIAPEASSGHCTRSPAFLQPKTLASLPSRSTFFLSVSVCQFLIFLHITQLTAERMAAINQVCAAWFMYHLNTCLAMKLHLLNKQALIGKINQCLYLMLSLNFKAMILKYILKLLLADMVCGCR